MNSRERMLAALDREEVDGPPGWVMRQAGRYLPEYRALREGKSFLDTVHDSDTASEITCQPLRRFDMDAAIIFSDILVPPAAMGQGLEFVEGKGPVLSPPVRTAADVDALRDFDPEVATGFLRDALKKTRQEIGDGKALLGFCGGPFTTASYMIEGGGSREFANTKKMMRAEPALFDRLIARLTENLVPYLRMQVEAGADAVQVFESWGGALDARTFRERILPSMQTLVAAGRDAGARTIVFVNGSAHLLECLADAGSNAVGLDWRIDPADAMRRIGERVALQGNLDPTVLLAGPDATRREAARVLDAFANQRGYVFNLGHGILPPTPTESMTALFEELRSRRGRA